ncbi:MAG: family 20 glycosylhydrolase [Phycisphaerales bacterium]
MRKSPIQVMLGVSVLAFVMLPAVAAEAAKGARPWLGVHVMLTSRNQTLALAEAVPGLAEVGINAIVAEINYGFAYQSHPELASDNASSKEQIGTLVAECKKHKIRLIPQFQCLGHQSWSKHTFSFLTKYPQFDESPGQYPENKDIYCRSWCPLHPEVNPIIFSLIDELIDAFEADALHVGMDEVFLIGEESCPRCKGKDKAELFAKAVNDYHRHLVEEKKVEMLMWGDRLIDSGKIKCGEWEASANGTAKAIDLIANDIIICDWHYEPRDAYESVPMFLEKGFRVWPCSWKNAKAAKSLIDYSRVQNNPRMLGHLNTTWGAVPVKDLATFEPIKLATNSFKGSVIVDR